MQSLVHSFIRSVNEKFTVQTNTLSTLTASPDVADPAGDGGGKESREEGVLEVHAGLGVGRRECPPRQRHGTVSWVAAVPKVEVALAARSFIHKNKEKGNHISYYKETNMYVY